MTKCLYCQEEIPEGYGMVCSSCEKELLNNPAAYKRGYKMPTKENALLIGGTLYVNGEKLCDVTIPEIDIGIDKKDFTNIKTELTKEGTFTCTITVPFKTRLWLRLQKLKMKWFVFIERVKIYRHIKRYERKLKHENSRKR